MKRVLVTGAAGFVGLPCLSELTVAGYEVHATCRAGRAPHVGQVHWHPVDLLAREAVSALVQRVQPTHLLHLAWVTTPGAYWESSENLEWLQASLHLVGEFARTGGRRAVLVGTCAEYAWTGDICREYATPLNPTTLYGACKHALHVAAEAFAVRRGLSLAWPRLLFLYGPREPQQRLVASIIRALLHGKPAACGNGQQVRDFLHAADAGSALVALLDSPVEGPVNIASAMPAATGDIIRTIANLLHHPELIQWGSLPARPGDPAVLTADVTRLREEVGWRPCRDLVLGLRETIAWWRTQVG